MLINFKGWKYNTEVECNESITQLNSYFNVIPPMAAAISTEGNYNSETFYYISESPVLPISEVLGEPSDITIEEQNI